MRWRKPKIGDKRERKVFCWLPRDFEQNGTPIVVWLESVYLTEEYVYKYEHIKKDPYWVPVTWREGPTPKPEVDPNEAGKLTLVK